jgi:hypothetical protein
LVKLSDEMLVEFNESQRIELLTGLSESALGENTLACLGLIDRLEKMIQLVLNRSFEHVDEEEDHDFKGEASLSDKCFGGKPVSVDKVLVIDNIFQ